MQYKHNWMKYVILIVIVSMFLSACGTPATPTAIGEPAAPSAATEAPAAQQPAGQSGEQPTAAPAAEQPAEAPAAEPVTTDRHGGWLDSITFVEEASSETAVSRIDAGEIQLHAETMADADILEQIKADPNLAYFASSGSNDEITFNPYGPVFDGTGKLNPFSDAKIREAVNYVIDRNYIVQEILGGLGRPKFLPIVGGFPEYVRYMEKAREIEAKYAFDFDKGKGIIDTEMQSLGAELVDGKWQYNGAPVQLIGIIRTEDERTEVGDYFSNVLEDLGFTVDRQYKSSSEASPIWLQSNPADGLWNFYTGAWITKWVLRDESSQFDFMYTTRGLGSPLWEAYKPSEEFDTVADRLNRADYNSMDERKDLFERAMELSLEDSVRVNLVDVMSYTPMASNVQVAGDLAAGIQSSMLWASTLRYADQEGGDMTVSNVQIMSEPWNPIGGTNYAPNSMVQRATMDRDTVKDPFTGLARAQRIERAEVTVKEGLPVEKSLDWVDLQFVPEIQVPEDAWVDWDAANQTFIPASEKFPEGTTAKAKTVVYYPDNLDTITWHDGSQFSVADIMIGWILSLDTGKVESPIYDEGSAAEQEAFLNSFRGWRLVSEKPLVIEMYNDWYFPQAEDNVYQWLNFWTEYNYGTGAWHNIGLGILAEQNNELAFTATKADEKEVEWTSFLSGPSLDILNKYLDQAIAEDYIPYATTLGNYITPEEAAARWQNLKNWYAGHGHFWIGTGPYFIDKVYPVESMITLKNNPDYIDTADKWASFSEPAYPVVEVDGPGRVTAGDEASFDVYVSFEDAPYAAANIDQVKFLVFDANNELLTSGGAAAVEDGLWNVTLTSEQTAQLEAGSNRLEVAVASNLVSIPSFTTVEFVTVP